jgi:Raf kinase inhibitor-like YbhB/YbcL family protein
MPFTLMSPAFVPNAPIPKQYTGDGDDCSPPVAWIDAPPETRSFVLTVQDPDAPSGLFHHWTLFNIPRDHTALPEGFPGRLPLGDMQELNNGFGHTGYGGPLPPHGDGPHRYVFTLHALSVDRVDASPAEDPEALLRRLAPATIAKAEFIGIYER